MLSSGELAFYTATLIALFATGGWCVWLIAQRRSSATRLSEIQAQRDSLSNELTDARTQVETYRLEIAALKDSLAAAKQQIAVATETHKNVQQQFEKAQQQLREAFKSLAGDTLKQSTEQFLHLAKKSFENEQKDAAAQLEQRKQAIEAMVKPIRESLGKYDASIKAVEEARRQTYGQLTKQVELMTADQRRLRQETANLVRALRKPNVRGRWGQVQLRRVVELAGMIPHCDFHEEHTVHADNRALRPDMIINLPNGRTIVVDAKTPLDAFLESLECNEDDQQHRFMQRHAEQLATKIKELSAKQYYAQFERSPEFVVMFIPGESFLYAALESRPDLSESAMERGVVLATPSTLISLLKAVALGWQEESITENAKRISVLGQELYDRLAVAVGHVGNLGKALGNAVDHYDKFVRSFDSRVLVSAKKFQELGVQTAKTLPTNLPQLDKKPHTTRSLQSKTIPSAEHHQPVTDG